MKSTRSDRRTFLLIATSATAGMCGLPHRTWGADEAQKSRARGMLLGSLIGDAAGGPVEFVEPSKIRDWMPATRDWQADRRLTPAENEQLAADFRLLSYEQLRPEPAPYAHWTPRAAAGTVTDDSRHKFLLMAALRNARDNSEFPIDQRDLAREYVGYSEREIVQKQPGYTAQCEEWLREYNQAARWVLGHRNPQQAAPPERLWGGVATNAGQMVLLPLAVPFSRDPSAAYRASFQLGFMDNGTARDINSAIVAGLAAGIGSPQQLSVEHRWQEVEAAMRTVDPFRFNEIPWVERPVVRWLNFATNAARRANGSPRRLFEILEQEGEPRFHWDAHFVLASAWAILVAVNFNPLAALHLSLDFGHDTDSAAQLVGAFAGAVCGEEIFPVNMRQTIESRLKADYGESVEEWTSLLLDLQDRSRYPTIVAGSSD